MAVVNKFPGIAILIPQCRQQIQMRSEQIKKMKKSAVEFFATIIPATHIFHVSL